MDFNGAVEHTSTCFTSAGYFPAISKHRKLALSIATEGVWRVVHRRATSGAIIRPPPLPARHAPDSRCSLARHRHRTSNGCSGSKVACAAAARADPDWDEVAAECDEVRVAGRDNGRSTLTVESAGGDQGAAEFLPQMLRGDRGLALGNILGALDARLDHVKIGDAQAIKLACDIAESCGRIAVRH